MNTKQPRILLTNDDSIQSPGIWAAAEALSALGYVEVVSPREQQTAMGRAFPRHHDMIIKPQTLNVHGKDWTVYSIGGSPAQAVRYGLLEFDLKPDLVVSGINYGENVANGITISGTVGAALEAASEGIPSIAISLETDPAHHYDLSDKIDFSAAAHFCRYFAEKLLTRKMPFDVDLLKIDVPAEASPQTEWEITRQSRTRYYYPYVHKPATAEHGTVYGYYSSLEEEAVETDSDVYVLAAKRKVSVTPLSIDMTSRVSFDDLKTLLN
ncbi:MAG: 5'/3'-nucleotidase SurE [Anaerolineaceae bacterium]|nr:5'/3'-nucleotidase SurE [Anaerolineaceae bacterium]